MAMKNSEQKFKYYETFIWFLRIEHSYHFQSTDYEFKLSDHEIKGIPMINLKSAYWPAHDIHIEHTCRTKDTER